MKVNTLVSTAFVALSLFATSNSFATTILMDPTTNNGSFEQPLDGSETGGSASTGSEGGIRYSSSSAGDLTIPGWTLTKGGAFGGLNFSGSTQSDDGLTNVVINDGAITGTSDPIAIDALNGPVFEYSGAFQRATGSGGTYSLSYLFSDATSVVVADQVSLTDTNKDTMNLTVPYDDQVSGSFSYSGSATSVQVIFTIEGGSGAQKLADDFRLTQAVPEPSSLLLAASGLLLGIARRR